MDFLDSLDLQIPHKKSRRVRSWYLYEQFKSLERNQLEAAQKLKDRSYQERILRQELSDRKARRKLYDQFGVCQSESQIERTVNNESTKTSLNVSTDDFFESFCEVHEGSEQVSPQDLLEDLLSQNDSLNSNQYADDFESISNTKEDNSYAESVNSVVNNVKSHESFVKELEEEMRASNTGESINLQLEAVKENIECLENITMLDDVTISEDTHSVKKRAVKRACDKNMNVNENNLLAVWTRLVSFAYQIMKFNHGNCYYDYSSQFLTAVLACDVLRRGVGRMCNILQPYVSPIKYATDNPDAFIISYKNVKRKKLVPPKKSWNAFEYKSHSNHKAKPTTRRRRIDRKNRSENYWQHCSRRYSLENRINDQIRRRASEPRRSVPKFSHNKSSSASSVSSSSIWPNFSKPDLLSEIASKETCNCSCHRSVLTPMLKLSQYLDSIMKDIDDYKRM